MSSTTLRARALPGSMLLAAALALSACGGGGGFGGTAASSPPPGAASGAAASGPQLSAPPPIEGAVVTEGESRTIKFGIGLAETSPQYLSVVHFRDVLAQRTNGRLKVDIFPNSQVGDDKQMMSALQSGSLDMTYPSTSPATALVPELRLFDLPFLFPEAEDADKVLDGPIGTSLLKKFDGTGIKALAWAENGYRQLTNSNKAVTTPEDVKGLRLRVMENPIQVDIWKTLGANPTSMAFGEVFSALEQGVVDGQENPWATIFSSKFNEVQDYGSDTRHVYTPFIIMASQQMFDGLSPEDQAIVQEAAEATRDYDRTISREFADYAKTQLKAGGMNVNDLTAEQQAAFQEATQPVYDKWAPEIGSDLVAEVQSQIDAG